MQIEYSQMQKMPTIKRKYRVVVYTSAVLPADFWNTKGKSPSYHKCGHGIAAAGGDANAATQSFDINYWKQPRMMNEMHPLPQHENTNPENQLFNSNFIL